MITEAIDRISNQRHSLSRAQASSLMEEILAGRCSDAQIAGLLVALHMKGETIEEVVGFAEAIRAAAPPFPSPEEAGSGGDGLVDTCGTGGDASSTFNISTAAAIVAAGAGVRVAKHGNRKVTSRCGSADVMEALGVNLHLPPEQLSACLSSVGLAFLFAPELHSAMKAVQAARRELRMRTVFNLLGPLTNPARATAQVVGVYSAELVDKVAHALRLLGLRRALVVHGSDGMDEITLTGPTLVAELREDGVQSYEITPEQFGMKRAPIEELVGGDAGANAAIIREILRGEKSARRHVTVLNAAAALLAGGKANHLSAALPLAERSIDSGAAERKLDHLIEFGQAFARS
jgi:anthranilate phosphoribosyltransferase